MFPNSSKYAMTRSSTRPLTGLANIMLDCDTLTMRHANCRRAPFSSRLLAMDKRPGMRTRTLISFGRSSEATLEFPLLAAMSYLPSQSGRQLPANSLFHVKARGTSKGAQPAKVRNLQSCDLQSCATCKVARPAKLRDLPPLNSHSSGRPMPSPRPPIWEFHFEYSRQTPPACLSRPRRQDREAGAAFRDPRAPARWRD